MVVIPCHNEPDLIASLQSLHACYRPDCAVELIVVINGSSDSPAPVRAQNERTYGDALEWSKDHVTPGFVVHVLHYPDLPPKDAGVGFARKIGMDEALWRLALAGGDDGVIACFDADCRCDTNYLEAVVAHFRENPATPGCSIHFEHPLSGDEPAVVYEAIALYELHLRYYVEALRYAGFPFAFQTIGSSMAVRAGVYREQGGMNKRKAGEDFYFLHKIIPLGGFTNLTRTTVHPSPRPSDRVPFGTGKAVRRYLENGEMPGYPRKAFQDLKFLFAQVPALCAGEKLAPLPAALESFCDSMRLNAVLEEIRGNTSTRSAFQNRFFRVFNGFQVMKFVHHACRGFYGAAEVRGEAAALLEEIESTQAEWASLSPAELLRIYRRRALL